ncbi:MAG TPA: hypothetical protein V6C95_19265, partial [Coleofasciculaceae cyanobacterium]
MQSSKIPCWVWLLLAFGSFYSFILGTFLGGSPLYWGVPIALAIAVTYCVFFCLFQRRATWVSIAVTVAVAAILTQLASVVDFMTAYMPS